MARQAGCCGASRWARVEGADDDSEGWSSKAQFGSSGGPVSYLDRIAPPWGSMVQFDVEAGPDDGGDGSGSSCSGSCSCSVAPEKVESEKGEGDGCGCGPSCGCAPCVLETLFGCFGGYGADAKSAQGLYGRRAGVLDGPPSDMTEARWVLATNAERAAYAQANHLNLEEFDRALMQQSFGGDTPRGDTGDAGGDVEVDPNTMTRSRWNAMTEAQRQTWMRDFASNAAERNRLIAAAATQGFNGIVQVLQGRRDVEIAEINARRDVEIARIRGNTRAEDSLLNQQRNNSSNNPPSSSSSSSAATLGIGAMILFALLRGGV